MSVLVFVCPVSGRDVPTGIEIDAESFKKLSNISAEILCADCGSTHNLREVQLRLVG